MVRAALLRKQTAKREVSYRQIVTKTLTMCLHKFPLAWSGQVHEGMCDIFMV